MAPDDPLRGLVVDRVQRADGRYLLYYRWPHSESPPLPPDATGEDRRQDEDV